MPVLQTSRQPDPLSWFDTVRGLPLLAAEQVAIRTALDSRPGQQPWLWVACGAPRPDDAAPPPRALRLYRHLDGFSGTLRCGLPLPLPNESIGNIILQHALDDGAEALLEECERVLEPGGRVWLFTLNPWSPYRARWSRTGLASHEARGWRHVLRRLGLQPCGSEVTYLGPVWRAQPDSQSRAPGRLRAICLLEVEKRAVALIPPAPVGHQWQAGASPA